jgi:hypothetical protein
MGEEVLGPMKVQWPNVGECQEREAGEGGLVNRREGDEIFFFFFFLERGNKERG